MRYYNQSNINGFNLYDYTNNKFINAKHNSSIINLGTIGMSAKSGTTSVFRNLPYVPEWLEILATGLDHGFTMINPIRSAVACLKFTDLWDLMRLDGITELPGTLSKVATGIG